MKSRPVWLGIVLIVVGLAMLFDHLHILSLSWWLVFWSCVTVVSATLVIRNSRRKEGGTFWLTVLFFFGLYKTLRHLGTLDIPASMGFPLLLIFAGVGIAVVVFTYPAKWHLGVIALTLLGVGIGILLAELNVIDDDNVRTMIENYWPFAVILFGAALLLNSGLMKKEPT